MVPSIYVDREQASDEDELVAELSAYLDENPDQRSLPPAAFVSEAFYRRECERIFGRSWILIGRTEQIADPGDYVSLMIGSEQVVVVRDKAGVLHGMSPICRHRLMPVVDVGVGHLERFTCPQHLWKYGLDGRLIGATYMHGVDNFDSDSCQLPALAVEEWEGFVYVNCDPDAEPLAPQLTGMSARLAGYQLADRVQISHDETEWRTNWKIAVENASETYHHMGFHPETVNPILPSSEEISIETSTPAWWSMRHTYPQPIVSRSDTMAADDIVAGRIYSIFPCASFFTVGDVVGWASFIPLAPDRTQFISGELVAPGVIAGGDVARPDEPSNLERANEEDRKGVEAIQRMAASRFAGRGPLSPKEPGLILFYQSLARALC